MQSGLLDFINHWWNLPYLVMLGLVGSFFVLQIVGLLGNGHEADVHVDTDVDHDVDVEAPDHDVDVDQAMDADHDGDGDQEALAGGAIGWQAVLSFFGVGRVPIMVVWVTFFIFAGFTGIFVNSTLFVHHGGVLPTWGFLASLGASAGIGLCAVRLFSRMAAKFVDVGGRGATKKTDLTGRTGVVASLLLDQQFGEVRVKDAHGNELLLHGRLLHEDSSLKRGEKVVLIDYDPAHELYWVTRSPEEGGEKRS